MGFPRVSATPSFLITRGMGGRLESGLGQQRLGVLEDNNPPLLLCTGLFRFITGPESEVSILFRSQRQEVFDSGFLPLQPHTHTKDLKEIYCLKVTVRSWATSKLESLKSI